jgi:hypothetical protein
MDDIKTKLQQVVDTEIKYATERGYSSLSTCDYRNWDKDIWNHRHTIIEAIKNNGFHVSISTNWGVLDIVTTPIITLD